MSKEEKVRHIGDEIKHLMVGAMHEIRDLRRRCEVAEAKVSAFELAGRLLGAEVRKTVYGEAPDLVCQLQKAISELNDPGPMPPLRRPRYE